MNLIEKQLSLAVLSDIQIIAIHYAAITIAYVVARLWTWFIEVDIICAYTCYDWPNLRV